MLPADEAHLRDEGLKFEEAEEGGFLCVVIRDYPLPAGYQIPVTDLLLRLPPGFPDAAPDMWWCDPVVRLADGRMPPAAESMEQYVGRTWQRFSRHFAGGQWSPTANGLAMFLAVIRRDFERGAGGNS